MDTYYSFEEERLSKKARKNYISHTCQNGYYQKNQQMTSGEDVEKRELLVGM